MRFIDEQVGIEAAVTRVDGWESSQAPSPNWPLENILKLSLVISRRMPGPRSPRRPRALSLAQENQQGQDQDAHGHGSQRYARASSLSESQAANSTISRMKASIPPREPERKIVVAIKRRKRRPSSLSPLSRCPILSTKGIGSQHLHQAGIVVVVDVTSIDRRAVELWTMDPENLAVGGHCWASAKKA